MAPCLGSELRTRPEVVTVRFVDAEFSANDRMVCLGEDWARAPATSVSVANKAAWMRNLLWRGTILTMAKLPLKQVFFQSPAKDCLFPDASRDG